MSAVRAATTRAARGAATARGAAIVACAALACASCGGANGATGAAAARANDPRGATASAIDRAPRFEDALDGAPDLVVALRPRKIAHDRVYGPLWRRATRAAAARAEAVLVGTTALAAFERADEVIVALYDRGARDGVVAVRGVPADVDPAAIVDTDGRPIWSPIHEESDVVELVPRDATTDAALFVLPRRTWVIAVGAAVPRATIAYMRPAAAHAPAIALDPEPLAIAQLRGDSLLRHAPRFGEGALAPIGRDLDVVELRVGGGERAPTGSAPDTHGAEHAENAENAENAARAEHADHADRAEEAGHAGHAEDARGAASAPRRGSESAPVDLRFVYGSEDAARLAAARLDDVLAAFARKYAGSIAFLAELRAVRAARAVTIRGHLPPGWVARLARAELPSEGDGADGPRAPAGDRARESAAPSPVMRPGASPMRTPPAPALTSPFTSAPPTPPPTATEPPTPRRRE